MKQFSGQDCNDLLKQIQEKRNNYFAKSNNEHQFVALLELKEWHEQTNTLNDVTLCGRQAGYPMRPEIRIAQARNTLWEIATDRLAENNGGKKEGFNTSDVRAMVKDSAALNAISDPSKLRRRCYHIVGAEPKALAVTTDFGARGDLVSASSTGMAAA